MFPCLVTAPDGGVYRVCRVHSGPDGTKAYWWDPELGDARVVVSSDYAPEATAHGSRHYDLPTVDGSATIIHETGCGCGHPMKRWRLPAPVMEGS